jgi:YebC/PmpR family DNA-binding regulatory protein
MSGHSHWSTIKHKKGLADAKKGKSFSKVVRLLMVAAREGGADPTSNLKLQYALDKAREVNMPRDNVDKAIKKGSGETDGIRFETSIYEGYGPGGVAFMVETLTDNRNRTVSEIRKIMESRGGSLGAANCVSWLFERKGLFLVPATAASEDAMINLGLELGADDVQLAGDVYEITCTPTLIEKIKASLIEKGITLKSAEITSIPKNYISVDATMGKRLLDLTELLEDHDDVQNIYANFDLPPEVADTSK